MAESIVVFISRGPYGLEDAFAGLRFALSQIASGVIFDVTVILMEEGVLNAKAGQQSYAIGMPSNFSAIEDLLALDVAVYVINEDVEALGLKDQLGDGVEGMDRAAVPALVDEKDIIVTF